ncbi:hypothetical protein VTH06DRAFT_131 [Thermothelomyces fergusii]
MYRGQGRPMITRRRRSDLRILEALRLLGVSIRKREVQIELTNLLNEATALAQRVAFASNQEISRSEFVLNLQQHNRLGRLLTPVQFEQLFSIVLARYRNLESWYIDGLPEEHPTTHCHLARAVDAFEAAAWFWSTVEAFLEDDQARGDDAERAASSSYADDDDLAYGAIAVGVEAMDLNKDDADESGRVGSEMEADG